MDCSCRIWMKELIWTQWRETPLNLMLLFLIIGDLICGFKDLQRVKDVLSKSDCDRKVFSTIAYIFVN